MRSIARFVGVLLLAFSVLPAPAKATALVSNQAMEVTFQQPVRIPGNKVLPAGTYWFTVPTDAGTDSSLNNVQISNADGTKVIADFITEDSGPDQFGGEVIVNGVRKWPTGKAVMILAEGSKGQAPALINWYYPGRTDGHQFVYSSRRERQLNEEKHVTLSFRPGDTITVGRDLASLQ